MKSPLHIVVIAAVFAALVEPAVSQDHGHDHATELGRVTFQTSCAPSSHASFERGVAALHSFYFSAAIQAFEAALQSDARCAMAYWGIALARMGNPFVGQEPPADGLRAGRDAADRAAAQGPPTAREAGYVAAVRELYRGYETRPLRERMRAYEQAMDSLRRDHPEDVEGAIFYALAVVANAPPDDLTFERQIRVSEEILLPLFDAHPDHPGLAHYIIHAFDSPPVAERGLDAAFRYAEIAPSAPHALHMPSHIFTRLGYWEESIETNRRSFEAEDVPAWKTHPLDYMVYAHLQLGQDDAAREALEESRRWQSDVAPGALGYNWVAMEARYLLELGRWSDAARVAVPGLAPGFVTAVSHFARGIGAARSGEAADARREAEALEQAREALELAGEHEWARRVEAQQLAVGAWAAYASGERDDAVRLARAAAEVEEQVEKHPVTPGPLLPARELEGDLLLELGRPGDAYDSYTRVLTYEPRRARALYGAARAAELAGNEDAARLHYAEFVELLSVGDGTRPELETARTFLR